MLNISCQQLTMFSQPHRHNPKQPTTIWDKAERIFWQRLTEGEFIQACWLKAVTEAAPDVPIMHSGRVPTNQIVWEGWGFNDIHANNSKPILYVGWHLLTAPDQIMVVHDQQYATEVKSKALHAYYMNVIIDTKEITEILEAAQRLKMEPLFVFHLRGEEDPHPSEYVGDFDKAPPLTSYCVATLNVLDGLQEMMTNGKRGYRIPLNHLTPAATWLGVEDAE